MFTAKVQNAAGDELILTANESVYQLVSILGLNPPNAQINMSTIVGLDGAIFNSSKLETRNIVLTVFIKGNMEENRQNLYRYFPTKQQVRFYFQNQNRDVYIDGYVDTLECDLFQNGQKAQVSIICPYPYFRSTEENVVDISSVRSGFQFPFAINYGEPIPFASYETERSGVVENKSDSETGALINVRFTTAVNELTLVNLLTGEWITLEYAFQSGDYLTINTNKGHKSVVLIRGLSKTSLFSAIKKGSVFFQLQPGYNDFSYYADDGINNGAVFIEFVFADTYRGV